MNNLLVVCEANICRSPMAQGLLAASLPGRTVRSAGLNALVGMPPDEVAIRALLALGIDISLHRATQVTRELCLQADLVLVMTAEQRVQLENLYPAVRGRVFRLCESSDRDVSDPYRQSKAVYDEAALLIRAGVGEWLQRLGQVSPGRP